MIELIHWLHAGFIVVLVHHSIRLAMAVRVKIKIRIDVVSGIVKYECAAMIVDLIIVFSVMNSLVK